MADDHWIHEAAVPLILIFNTLCFLHISVILMPLYSVTVHTSSLRFNKNLFHKLVKQAFHRLLVEVNINCPDLKPNLCLDAAFRLRRQSTYKNRLSCLLVLTFGIEFFASICVLCISLVKLSLLDAQLSIIGIY